MRRQSAPQANDSGEVVRNIPSGTQDVNIVGGGGSGVQYDEDTASVAAEKITMAGVVRKDTAVSLVDTDGDRTELEVDSAGRLHVSASAGVDVTDRALRDNGKVDIAAFDASLPAGTNNIGDVDVLSLPLPTDASTETTLALIKAKTDNLDVALSTRTKPADTQNVQIAAETANKIEVQGDVAHDAAAAGNPVLIGVRANANEPTAVADADATHLWADLFGRLVVLTGHPSPEAPVTANGGAAGLSVIAAPGASLSLYICKGSVHNSAATESVISLRDGAAGTIRWTINAAADGGGSLFDFGSRGWKLTANTALVADIGAATGYINITEYYIAP